MITGFCWKSTAQDVTCITRKPRARLVATLNQANVIPVMHRRRAQN